MSFDEIESGLNKICDAWDISAGQKRRDGKIYISLFKINVYGKMSCICVVSDETLNKAVDKAVSMAMVNEPMSCIGM